MGDSHNFFIGDLGFHKAVNPERPYERATAPFRKEQFDAAPTVGDQSLSGWWTRGQMSFHKGAGVKYYEVLDGEDVLDRFRWAYDADTLSTPGEVSIGKLMNEDWVPETASEIRQAVSVGGSDVVYLTVDNALWSFFGYPSPGSTITPTAVTVSGASPSVHYVARGAKDYECYVAVTDGGGANIQRLTKSGGAWSSVTVYTLSSGGWRGLWFAKGRLWALTTEGGLYALAEYPSGALPVAMSSPSMSVTLGTAAASLAESPAGVFLALGGNILYTLGIDADGAVPTLAAPVVSAELPREEGIRAMRFYLGKLVVVTSSGVRLAEPRSDGSVVYGPHVVKWYANSNSCRQIAAYGSSVYVTGPVYGVSIYEVCQLNLAEMVGSNPLVVPWTTMYDWADPGYLPQHFGAFDYGDHVALFSGKRLRTGVGQFKLAPSATVRTGMHRLGTLDKKHFHSVEVRVGGAGWIYVYRQDDPDKGIDYQDPSVYVGEAPSGTGGAVTLPLGLSSPQESVGLHFYLQRHSDDLTAGPKLLGYQIKALPSPLRQRLIRVPLMMFDIERGPTGRSVGGEKSAWTRLQALELAEETDALVTFEDKDTGETGTAHIEAVELTAMNGSGGNSRSNGFGGIVMVTLRKV